MRLYCKLSIAATSDYCLRLSEVGGFRFAVGQWAWRADGCDPLCSSWQGLVLLHAPNPGPGNAVSIRLETDTLPLLWCDPTLHLGLQ